MAQTNSYAGMSTRNRFLNPHHFTLAGNRRSFRPFRELQYECDLLTNGRTHVRVKEYSFACHVSHHRYVFLQANAIEDDPCRESQKLAFRGAPFATHPTTGAC